MREHRIRLARALAGAVAALAVGYVSALISTRQCEKAAADEIARELGGRTAFVLPVGTPSAEGEYRDAEEILTRERFVVRRCDAKDGICFPWAGLARAQVVAPFLVDVRWGYVAAPLAGQGARTRYFTLFGWVFPLWDLGGWIT